MADLTTIEGIGDTLAAKLVEAGVKGTDALLQKGASKQGRQTLAEAAGIDEGRILKFVNHADLMRIKGIGGEFSELLEAAGVDTVPELAQRNAANLAAKMAEVNATKKLTRVVPTEPVVEAWVAQANTLDRVVTH